MNRNNLNIISLRWLKEQNLYSRWKYNVIKQNTLNKSGWLKNDAVNTSKIENIIKYGFNWANSIEGTMLWFKANIELKTIYI